MHTCLVASVTPWNMAFESAITLTYKDMDGSTDLWVDNDFELWPLNLQRRQRIGYKSGKTVRYAKKSGTTEG